MADKLRQRIDLWCAGRVEADLNSERKKAQSEKVIKAIVDTYKIEVDLRDGDGKDVADLGPRK